MTAPWVDNPADWEALAALARRHGRMGWDSETTGHNVKKSSPAYRARIDVWSLALPGPDGTWRGVVLPPLALESGPLREVLEDPSIRKDAHNANHDLHSAANHGVTVRGVVDSLSTARLAWPGLPSYTLKALRVAVLHKPERDGFKTLTRPMVEHVPHRTVACICGAKGCRKKSYPHVQFDVWKQKDRKHAVDIADIIPGHPRWDEKLDYAAEDAVDAPELAIAGERRLGELCLKLPPLSW